MNITISKYTDHHAFMVTNGSKDFRFAQWNVTGSDDDFFDKLRDEYKSIRGWLSRGWLRLGWFRYSHCEFFEVLELASQ